MTSSPPGLAQTVVTGLAFASFLHWLSLPGRSEPLSAAAAETRNVAVSSDALLSSSARHRQELADLGVAQFDQKHVVHPYASMSEPGVMPVVDSAKGVRLFLNDGRVVVDAISSWWACIHGYQNPVLDKAIVDQLASMSHVMFGGLTHRPAAELCALLLDIVPGNGALSKVFLCDSGSIAVEVAMKMAMQYWRNASLGGLSRRRFLTIKRGYHGDTFGAMSVCDPVNGMHHLFKGALAEQVFVSAPQCATSLACSDSKCECSTLAEMETCLSQDDTIAAVILEPLFQGAGGMFFYSPACVSAIRSICSKHKVLLIVDEIATGFGRTGTLFACDRAGVVPDILCLGKALTGGYVTMGATLTTEAVASKVGTLMHGPTFMANPLACACAKASVTHLIASPWKQRVDAVEFRLNVGLLDLKSHPAVADVRVLGAIGVVELREELTVETKTRLTKAAMSRGVWLRPFGNVIYTMPQFNAPISNQDVDLICLAIRESVREVFAGHHHLIIPALEALKTANVAAQPADPKTFV